MGIFDGVLLVSDLDGTLFNKTSRLSEENAAALHSFMNRGGRFTVATGRSLQGFETPRHIVPMNAPTILSNGALIYDYENRQALRTIPLSDGFLPLCQKAHVKFPNVDIEAHLPDSTWAIGQSEFSTLHREIVQVGAIQAETPADVPPGWLKALFIAAHDDLLVLRDWLLPHCQDRFDLMFSHPLLLEMQDMHVNKGDGAAWLADRLGISHENVYCAGDYQNDISMLSRFSSFSPLNAEPDVKASANQIGPDCNDHFIAWVVSRLEEKYQV